MKIGDEKLREEMIEHADQMSDALMNMSKRQIAKDIGSLLDLVVIKLGSIAKQNDKEDQENLINVLLHIQSIKGFISAHEHHDDPTPLQLSASITSIIEEFTTRLIVLSELSEKEQENKE